MVALPPLTKGSLRILRWPASISVIDAHYRSGKGGNLTEADEQALVYFALRVDAHPAKEECKPTEGKNSGSQELYVQALFHKRYCRNLSRRRPLLPFRWKDVPGAKVQQKNEATKFSGSVR